MILKDILELSKTCLLFFIIFLIIGLHNIPEQVPENIEIRTFICFLMTGILNQAIVNSL